MLSRYKYLIIVITYAAIDVACIFSAFYLVLLYRPQTVAFSVSFQNLFPRLTPLNYYSWSGRC